MNTKAISLGSILNNYLFYKSRLIPVALAMFGLIATGLYALGSLAALVVDIPENVNLALMLPLALFELSLGLYLALFGMRESTF